MAAMFIRLRRQAAVRSDGGVSGDDLVEARPVGDAERGPTKAEIVSPVIAVMSAAEIEPTVAPPSRLRPVPVQ